MTLHDKIIFMENGETFGSEEYCYLEKDVKKAVKELVRNIKMKRKIVSDASGNTFLAIDNDDFFDSVEEIFGEGLIQNSEDKK